MAGALAGAASPAVASALVALRASITPPSASAAATLAPAATNAARLADSERCDLVRVNGATLSATTGSGDWPASATIRRIRSTAARAPRFAKGSRLVASSTTFE
jgi:hypothetical protein